MPETNKLKIALLFGGRSAEHDVSIMSARSVCEAVDPALYDVALIKIARDGRWRLLRADDGFEADSADGAAICFVPGGGGDAFVVDPATGAAQSLRFDVALPILHGPFGEDGTLQGLLEVAGIPFVGSATLSSAIAMDKEIAKQLLRQSGLPVARALTWRRPEVDTFAAACKALSCSVVFVKPARLGSSIGISKVTSAGEFERALELAFAHDEKVLVEEFIEAREIECAVLEVAPMGELIASWPGEIQPALNRHGFYSYEAKYLDDAGARLETRAEVDDAVAAKVQQLARQAFRALGCEGLARVDFFLRPDGEILINELNTLPGFTPYSMYPKMMAAAGICYSRLISLLIAHALARAERRP